MKQPLIIIFGAGNKGRMLLRGLDKNPGDGEIHCFVDSDPVKWGSMINGLPVHRPGYLQTLPPGSFRVFIAIGPGYPQVQQLLAGYGLIEGVDFFDARISALDLTEIDEQFRTVLGRIRGYTLLGEERLQPLHQFAKACAHLPGETAELGVFRGGSAYLLASVFSESKKTLRLFDTFSGIPSAGDIDIHREGDFSGASLDEVKQFLSGFPNIVFHSGEFPGTATGDAASAAYCFVHVDADVYRSVLDACIFFQPRLSPGGIMLFDDYGYPTCPGVRKAVDEYFADKTQKPIYLPSGQALVINQDIG